MIIEPNTDLLILQDVPLDPSYQHTIYFSNSGAQASYFSSKVKYTFSNYSYQRVNSGITRVSVNAESLYNCNYMMFRNTNFGNRWFYAFITKVDYIANKVTQITFKLDIMQTWLFDYQLLPCIVERQHTESDEIGTTLTAEPFSVTNYIESNIMYSDGSQPNISPQRNYKIAIFYNPDETFGTITGGYIGTTFSGVKITVCDTPEEAIAILSGLGAKVGDLVVNIVMFPSWISTNGLSDSPSYFTNDILYTYNTDSVDGYKPKNKKLLQYPFTKITVSGNAGKIDFRPENVSNKGQLKFRAFANIAGNPDVYLKPINYAGSTDATPSGEYALAINGFSKCAFTYSAYQQWLAYHGGSIVSSISNSVLGGYTGMLTTGISLTGQFIDAMNQPNKTNGSLDGNGLCGAGILCYQFSKQTVTAEMAKVYDDYFTKYGYAIQRLQTPNRTARPNYTYVKTQNCEISGSLPADDAAEICKIYDDGITWWRNGNNVGNYSVNNNP